MIFTDKGIILLRQPFREADRVVSIYTLKHGRINVRVPGVLRSTGKLKALSEPLSCAELRVYIRRGGVMGTLTGGKIESVFPAVRGDLKRLSLALHFCELILRLTPLHQPSEQKFNLLYQAFTELEQSGVNAAFQAAFTLRLMMLAGFGLDHPVLQISPEFWQRMHEDKFSNLVFTEPEELLSLAKCNNVCRRFLNQYLTYPLHTTEGFTLKETSAPIQPPAEKAAVPTAV
ncbi:MAG: DNA repair protein RecO [Elusimicrobiaceae bacterium]|nr:DNA repair protein RecO [Elusimicrobiaceae bacterium]